MPPHRDVNAGKVYARQYYLLHRDKLIAKAIPRAIAQRRVLQDHALAWLRTHPCVDCGEVDVVVLDFDHVRGRKRDGIAQLIHLGVSTKTLDTEIAKCEVRCANCHRRKTARERGWYKFSLACAPNR